MFWEEQQAIEAQENPSPNAPAWMAQATAVSHYAGNNQLEFVAEVFTGQLVGKTTLRRSSLPITRSGDLQRAVARLVVRDRLPPRSTGPSC